MMKQILIEENKQQLALKKKDWKGMKSQTEKADK